MSTKSLLKSAGIISFGTATSRVLGFVRDILIANFFGTGAPLQAFLVAFRIPNLLRHFVAEGAVNSAFVPVLSEYLIKKEKKDYWHLANILLWVITIILIIIVLIGIVAAPLIVKIMAPGFAQEEGVFKLAVSLTRVIFPYIFFIGLAAYAMGLLNSLKHFTAPAFAPVLLNLSIIMAVTIFKRDLSVQTLALAVLAGGAAQLIVQIPVLIQKGMRVKIPKTLYHPTAGTILKLLLPRMLGATVYQINILVDTILASLHWIVGAGGIAALYYSNRLIQLPTAIFGIALATASLPTLSSYYTKKNTKEFKDTLNFSLKALLIVMVPATIGLMVMGHDIVRVLFQRGEFTSYSTTITYNALLFYGIGLFSYGGIKILVFCFYSMRDTMTPVKTAAISLIINVVLNLILMWRLKIGGLALATSIAGISNFFMLLFLLRKRIGAFSGEAFAPFLIKLSLAGLIMGTCLYVACGITTLNAFGLALAICAGGVIYFSTLVTLRVRELGKFGQWILKRR